MSPDPLSRRAPAMSKHESERVRQYYDSNTRWMLRFGLGRDDGSIHRAVWGPGVRNRRAALAYVDGLLIDRIRAVTAMDGSAMRVVDLGCGVGTSLCRIAQALPVRGLGVTLSRTQVDIGSERIEVCGLSDRVRLLQADFCALPAEALPADAAFAIESFVHASDPVAFFRECARLVRPGGRLMVCDDFLHRNASSSPQARQWVSRFERGWELTSLAEPRQVDCWAADAGFVLEESLDLTSQLRLGTLRDRLVTLVARGPRWLPLPRRYWHMLRGGDALQVCLRQGWVQYRLLVWRRTD